MVHNKGSKKKSNATFLVVKLYAFNQDSRKCKDIFLSSIKSNKLGVLV